MRGLIAVREKQSGREWRPVQAARPQKVGATLI